jgi:hypothetical protein
MTSEKMKAPMPAEVDTLSEEFTKLKDEVFTAVLAQRDAQAKLDEKKLALIQLVSEHGSVHGEKSKLLHGIVWEIMASFGQYTKQDSAAIERLRQALVKAKKARLLGKLFKKDVRWTFDAKGMEVVKNEKLTPKLMALLLMCSVTEDKTPTVDVRKKKEA